MVPYKNRCIEIGTRISVHLNLHKNLYSITALEGEYKGKVVGHDDEFILSNVYVKISKNGQERVRRERVKGVHAWLIGTYEGRCDSSNYFINNKLYYNPYSVDTFVDAKSYKKPTLLEEVYFCGKDLFYR